MDKLKPCPFCGSDAFETICTKKNCLGELYDTFTVICEKCATETGAYSSAEKAIEHWNARPAEDKLKAEIGRLASQLYGDDSVLSGHWDD